jgi:hypothetical protein
MSQQPSKPGHLDHLLATCPQRVDILAILATWGKQLSFFSCQLSFA